MRMEAGVGLRGGLVNNIIRLFVEADVGISFVPVIPIGKKLVEHLGWGSCPSRQNIISRPALAAPNSRLRNDGRSSRSDSQRMAAMV